jgi:hypothetical protein
MGIEIGIVNNYRISTPKIDADYANSQSPRLKHDNVKDQPPPARVERR